MDDLARFNQERWEALAKAGIEYSRPLLNLNAESARKFVDPEGVLGDIAGKEALCLAGGGGQQSAAFALLGATVTVLDITETQLERDRQAAAHYRTSITTIQGDMRDLSCFEADSFDIIYHAHSINFVPDARQVFRQVARVIREGGCYRLSFSNPFTMSVDESSWSGQGYYMYSPYVDGEVTDNDPHWDFKSLEGQAQRILGPREFRHTLGTLVNGLVEYGFVIQGLREQVSQESDPEPGTWEHFKSVAAPFMTIWTKYNSGAFAA